MTACCAHLRANTQCPYAAMFVVEWVPHVPVLPGEKMTRLVCAPHLQSAIEDALAAQSRSNDAVTVKLAENYL